MGRLACDGVRPDKVLEVQIQLRLNLPVESLPDHRSALAAAGVRVQSSKAKQNHQL